MEEEDEGGSGLLVGRERRVEAMMVGVCLCCPGEGLLVKRWYVQVDL